MEIESGVKQEDLTPGPMLDMALEVKVKRMKGEL